MRDLRHERAPPTSARSGRVETRLGGVRFALAIGGRERRRARSRFAGRHNVVNALAAAGAGLRRRRSTLDADRRRPRGGASRARGAACGGARRGITILDDCYNANPVVDARRARRARRGAPARRRRVVVLGDMLELGAGAEAAHREVGRAIAAAGVAELIARRARTRATAVEAARAAGLAESHHAATARTRPPCA